MWERGVEEEGEEWGKGGWRREREDVVVKREVGW
jgi:hypothetical protein